MTSSIRAALRSRLEGAAWLLFGIAGLTFLVGGRAIHEFSKADRLLGEMEGLGLAVVLAGLGVGAETIANGIPEDSEDHGS